MNTAFCDRISRVAGGVGVALGAALGTTAGFINGFIIGAGAGTASGALGGFGNGLLAGEGLGSSLNRGWRGAKTGFITGGVIGGVSGGVYSIKRGGNFFTAVGMRHAIPASIQVEGTTDPVNYSNASAREFSDQYIGTPSGLRNLYADGSAPPVEKMVGDLLTYRGETAQGITEFQGNGVSDVWLARHAFSPKEQLFIVMKHEYLHVGYNSMGLMSRKRQEAGARKWMLDQGKA